jgi:uncharacterized protein (TIGR04255 family)
MSQGGRTLPDYDNPPAIETVMGVYFLPTKGWKVPHFGLFWERVRNDYPKVEVRGPIIAAPAGESREVSLPSLEAEVSFPLRCWFHNRNETTLIQVQDSCFFQNWRRESESLEYLHYDHLRPTFERAWREFCDFLQTEGLGSPDVWRCEVTYINHIDRGSGWSTFAELDQIFPAMPGRSPSHSYLPTPDSVTFQIAYPMKGPEGQLTIHMQPVIRKTDGKDTIQLTLTARCRPSSGELQDILSSLDQDREWVVRGFTDFTTPTMHKIWRRKI